MVFVMYLRKIVLQNFRCFRHLSLDLHPRLTVLVAENGGGKTAVLDGLAIGLSPVLRYLSTANQRLSGPGIQDIDFRVERVAGNGRAILCRYTRIEVETTMGIAWDAWRAPGKGQKPSGRIGQKELARYAARILDSLDSELRELLPLFAYYGARRGWLPIPRRLRGTKKDYTQPTSALIDALEPLNDFKEMLNWFDIEEANELRANKGRRAEEFEPSESLEAVRAALVHILGKKYSNPHFNRQHKFVVETEEEPGELQVSQLSQGYQSMLALGMDFARRMALANSHLSRLAISELRAIVDCSAQWPDDDWPDFASSVNMAPAIMLVDEIDLHLHPSWQQRVLADLMRAFPCTQFVVTTHSPQVLTTLRKENIRILEQDEDGHWNATTPDFSPLAHESGDALAAIMETHPQPVIAEVTDNIRAYEQLARAGKAESEEARQIKERLNRAGFEFNDADMALFRYLSRQAESTGKEKK
jgi:predicted ATP-binding protein involved in virulence